MRNFVNAKGHDITTVKEFMEGLPAPKGDKLNWIKYSYYRYRTYKCKAAKTKDGFYEVRQCDGHVFNYFYPLVGEEIGFDVNSSSESISMKASVSLCNRIHAGNVSGKIYDWESYLKKGKFETRKEEVEKLEAKGIQVLSDIDKEEGRKLDTPWVLDPLFEQPVMTRTTQMYICGRDADWIDRYECRGLKKGEHGSTEDYSHIITSDTTSSNNTKIRVVCAINRLKYGWWKSRAMNRKIVAGIDPYQYERLSAGAMFMRSIR